MPMYLILIITDEEMDQLLLLDEAKPLILPASHNDPELTKWFMGFAPRRS